MKKSVSIFLLLLLCVCLFFLIWECYRLFSGKSLFPAPETRFELPEGLPSGDTAYIPICTGYELHKRQHYVLSYSEKERLANWVAYELTPCELIKTTDRSGRRFEKDATVKNGVQSYEYKNSGYDRGHLAPAADMSFSEEAMNESFLMSNIAPQLPAFNRGIWSVLENQVRNWVRYNGALYVVTGSIWDERSKRIAKQSIPVPGYYYKILFDTNKSSKGMIVFLIPNSDVRNSIFDYVITVDSLERLTAIDFFPQLPDSLENTLEAVVRKGLWPITN